MNEVPDDPNLFPEFLMRIAEDKMGDQVLRKMVENHNTMVGIFKDMYQIVIDLKSKGTPHPEWPSPYYGYVLSIITGALGKMEKVLAQSKDIPLMPMIDEEDSNDQD